jgi:hypothetical protein
VAKILNGALTASISGKLGPVVFYETRFGQVVASKGVTRVHKGAAAMSAKAEFRAATRAWALAFPAFKTAGIDLARHERNAANGQFIAAYLETLRTGFAKARNHLSANVQLQWGTRADSVPNYRWPVTKDGGSNLQGFAFCIEVGPAEPRRTSAIFLGTGNTTVSVSKANITTPFIMLAIHALPATVYPPTSALERASAWDGALWV